MCLLLNISSKVNIVKFSDVKVSKRLIINLPSNQKNSKNMLCLPTDYYYLKTVIFHLILFSDIKGMDNDYSKW